MGISRDVLRKEAKKAYKDQTKNVPKRQRISFSQFFKQYKEFKFGKIDDVNIDNEEEDFDFESIINIDEDSE